MQLSKTIPNRAKTSIKLEKGKILWFDALTGEGMVRSCKETRSVDNNSYYIHFTSIEDIDKNNYQWATDKDQEYLGTIRDMNCEFTLYNDGEFIQVDRLKLIK